MRKPSWYNFDSLTIKEIQDLYDKKQLVINQSYQRSYIWKPNQKEELVQSILEYNPIGLLVLWRNKNGVKEILDGQQRIQTILSFLKGKTATENDKKFQDLTTNAKTKFEAYDIPYIELEQSLSEDEVSTIFIRLQEGTTLSNGEKIYAFRGNFRDTFVNAFSAEENKKLFAELNDQRFKAKFLAAKMLFVELKSDYKKKIFPSLSYREFKKINSEYKTTKLPQQIVKRFNKNIEFLGKYLHGMLKALTYDDLIASYLLASYFTQKKTNDNLLGIQFWNFTMSFHHDLNMFSIYDTARPKGMKKSLFDKLRSYKQLNRKGISPDSLEGRFDILRGEWERRMGKITEKDMQRFFTSEQKITLYFKQMGICPMCSKQIRFGEVEADHIEKHEHGGKTEVDNGRLIHHKCHVALHKNEKLKS